MQIVTDAQLLEQIEAFLVKADMAPSKFGRDAIGDAALVFQLRDGKRSLSLRTAEKVVQFMSDWRPEEQPQDAAA
ncbi:MAG TPA: hypothetical protein VFJ46_17655 [Xanthobacteraceae bacterium]|nr:hypothetical protein [Xanthobacteraceae bacterium]